MAIVYKRPMEDSFKRARKAGFSRGQGLYEQPQRPPSLAVLALVSRAVDGRVACLCFDLASLSLLALHIGRQVRGDRTRVSVLHSLPRIFLPGSQGATAETVAIQTDQSAAGFLSDCNA